jgi:hypothetical protein
MSRLHKRSLNLADLCPRSGGFGQSPPHALESYHIGAPDLPDQPDGAPPSSMIVIRANQYVKGGTISRKPDNQCPVCSITLPGRLMRWNHNETIMHRKDPIVTLDIINAWQYYFEG